jgi:hypothetical protein
MKNRKCQLRKSTVPPNNALPEKEKKKDDNIERKRLDPIK